MTVPQRFQASTVRGAMTEARRVLGPDALLLDQRVVDGQTELLVMPVGRTAGGSDVTETAVEEVLLDDVPIPEAGQDADLGAEIQLSLPAEPATEPSMSAGYESSSRAASRPAESFVDTTLQDPLLSSLGFSKRMLDGLSPQAVTPRLALAEVLEGMRFSQPRDLQGLVPVIGCAGSGVTRACLQLAMHRQADQAPGAGVGFFAPTAVGLADQERLMLGAELLGAPHEVVTPTALVNSVGAEARNQTTFLDLSLSRFASYADGLALLGQRGVVRQLVVVVPVHWQTDIVRELLDPFLVWLAGQATSSPTVHLFMAGLDLSEDIGKWVAFAEERGWSLGFVSESPRLDGPSELLSPGRCCRLLLEQIDRSSRSTTVKQAQGAG